MLLNKNIILIVLLIVTGSPHSLLSQGGKPARAMVFMKSGNGVSGYLTGINIGMEDDTLVIYSAKQTEKILLGDLAKVVVLPRNKRGDYFLAGALLGTYVSTLLLGTVGELPSGFLEKDVSNGGGLLLTAILGVGVGGGVGVLIKSGSNDDLVLDFTRNEQERKSSRSMLYDVLSQGSVFQKIHFSLQGGHVFARVTNEFQEFIGFNNNLSEFNLLRKVQLTYSLDPDVEIGGAVQWSSEPKVSYVFYNSTSTYNGNFNQYSGSYSSYGYEQFYDVTGYYGVGKYKPFYTELPAQIDIAFGAGIGFAKIEYRRALGVSTNTYSNDNGVYQNTVTQNIYHHEVNESVVSAMLFGEFNYYVHEYLSLGLTADYAYFSPKTVPPEPGANFPKQTLSGNGCIGFVLGIHL